MTPSGCVQPPALRARTCIRGAGTSRQRANRERCGRCRALGSQFRARGFVGNTGKHEGSGCAGYAVSFVELMSKDLVAQWALARKNMNPDWSAHVDGKASVIERKRPVCPPKPNLKPYPDKVHDLMKD